ncbi:SusC/RagA family TonB-linked outer membrane protein [Labilibacter sediminis]|nr:SusC/RagA family TonB-linked outer membrane protein [Labilibacter sediminis]
MKKILKIYLSLFVLSCLCLTGVYGQQDLQNGRIISAEGKSVKDAVISIVGSDIKTTSDAKGYFNLSAKPGDIIRVEAGLVSQTYTLKEDKEQYVLKGFHEFLNVGLGDKQKIEEVSSAINTVYADELKNSVINPENTLYGQLAGLTVLQNGGAPWSRRPDMFIRGASNILVLIDGVERPLSSIIVDDIESISVLKDASALAIYGQRGANGAIVVKTKRGEYETFSVDASYQYGLNTPTRLPKMLDAYSYAQAVNEASALDGNPFIYSPWDLDDYKTGNQPYFRPNVDWMDEALKDFGTSTNFNTQFRGGGKGIRYFSSINYQTEKGLFDQTNLDDRYDSELKYSRFNIRANVDADITSSTLVSVNISASMNNRKYPGAGVSNIMSAIYHTPSAAYPIKTINGNWGGTDIYGNNPIALLSATGFRNDFHREILGDLTIKQDLDKLVKGLSAEATVAYDNSAIFYEGQTKTYAYESVDIIRDEQTGMITDTISTFYGLENDLEVYDGGHTSLSQWRRGTLRTKLNYEKSWGRSDLNTSLLYTQDKYVGDTQYNTFLHQNIAAYGHYAYDGKYIADVTLTYAGSSNLPDGDRFGFFPAVSGAWVMSEEAFMDNNQVFDLFKVRGSFGITGSDLIPPNLYDQQFVNGGTYYFTNNYQSNKGLRGGRLATTDLTYEKSIKSNLGVDMMMFGKLNLSLDAFYNKSTDILASTSGIISDIIGVNTPYQNDGEVSYQGVEADLMWKDKVGSFNYYLGGNFSYTKSEVININEVYRPEEYLKRTGQPLGQMFGLEAIGFFEDEADIAASPEQTFSEVRPGDVKYKDQNNDGKIDNNDQIAIGHSSLFPEIYYSFKLGFDIKGFGVDALFQGVANQSLSLGTTSVFIPLFENNNISEFSANRWVPQNMEGAELPRLSLDYDLNNYQNNSIWIAKADYLKLRSVDVYYNFPKSIVSKIKLGHAKIFARGMNLFSIDNIKMVDPEAKGVVYPTLASYHLGVNIGF